MFQRKTTSFPFSTRSEVVLFYIEQSQSPVSSVEAFSALVRVARETSPAGRSSLEFRSACDEYARSHGLAFAARGDAARAAVLVATAAQAIFPASGAAVLR